MTIQDNTGLYKTIQNSTGKQDYKGLVRTILDYDYTEYYRTIQDYIGLHQTIKDNLGLYRTKQNSI